MTRVLSVAAEVVPLVKTGGLADVVGALPGALKAHGVEMRVMVPGYPAVTRELAGGVPVHRFDDLFGEAATIYSGKAAGLDLLVLDAPHLYDRPGSPYAGPDGEWPDNPQRFAALGMAAARVGRGEIAGFVPDVVHAHDWHAALSAVYLRFSAAPAARTVLTLHNLAFQGLCSPTLLYALGLPQAAWSIDGVEFYGKINFLKGGLEYSDAITTVSPTYAHEIRTPVGGMGLDGVLNARRSDLRGILNGIDTTVWNPQTDLNLAATYSAKDIRRRAANKRAIEGRMNIASGTGLLFCVISRLTQQKGIDLIAACIDDGVAAGARFAILGTGEPALERSLMDAATRHPGRVGVEFDYDEELAHLLQGGADAILVPSRFEPCGLTQFYGLRYGCVPVVARVGGLADSIIDANDAALAAGVATGIQFLPVDEAGLQNAIRRALDLYRHEKTWRRLQQRGMASQVSWKQSAGAYAALYRTLAARVG